MKRSNMNPKQITTRQNHLLRATPFPELAACVLLICAAAFSAAAQSPDWPPAALEPAPIMQQISLSEGRFIPSTERWNLVWADQIIPYQHTSAQLEFAARHYVGSQKLWADQAAQFRAIDPNFLMVAYHLAAGLNPEKNSDCPDPKTLNGDGNIGVVSPEGYVSEWTTHFLPWLSATGISQGSVRFEDMFQHYDTVSPQTRVWHQDPYWLMNLDNPDWRQYIGDACLSWMQGNENEGCFFDVAVETNCYLYNPKVQNPAPGNFDWWAPPHHPAQLTAGPADRRAFADWMNAKYRDYFQTIYRRFHAGQTDYLVLPNVDQLVTTVYDPVWLDGDAQGETVDGVMMEGFGSYRGYDMWLTLERCVRHVTGRGKILIAQFTTSDAGERLRRTAMYMLVKNANSFINAVSEDVTWFPEYEVDLGAMSAIPADLELLRQRGSGSEGLWLREFEHGLVLVNSGSNPEIYTLPAAFRWRRFEPLGGGAVSGDGTAAAQQLLWSEPVSQVEIPPSGGIIMKKEAATPVEGLRRLPVTPRLLSCAPSPLREAHARLQLEIPMGMEGDWRLVVHDILGRCLQSQSLYLSQSGVQTVTVSLHEIPAGAYLLSLVHPRANSAAMRIILR